MKKKYYRLYIIVFMCILLIPFVGMIFWPTNETAEKKELASMPAIVKNGKYNIHYMQGLGQYFEEHFAFRQYFVTANAWIEGKILKTSTTDQVVIGKNGWLYFQGTMDDYIGSGQLSDREMYAVVHNLQMMQSYVESQGSQFLLAVVPNKNTIYNENMPVSYRRSEESNLKKMYSMLEETEIHSVDLRSVLTDKEAPMYYMRDTHWNNKGALEAYRVLMQALGKEYETYENTDFVTTDSHVGDLDEMLYPLAYKKEQNYDYQIDWNYQYTNQVEDNMTPWIETENENSKGTLLMFRDSFGEALLPFMAEEMQRAYFSRLVPYNLTQVGEYHPDYVIVERVERKIAAFATEIPIMSSPRVKTVNGVSIVTDSTMKYSEDGGYIIIKGTVDEKYMNTNTEILVTVRDQETMLSNTYQAFYVLSKEGDGNGYQINIPKSRFPEKAHINLTVNNGNEINIVCEKEIDMTKEEKKLQ